MLNKTGSSLIAAAARLRRRPVYALFGEEKIWPEALPAGDLFDRTPLDWFAGFVTDQGIRPSLAGAPLWPVEARPAQRLLD
ncbi:MAG TPA: hypothetical protein DEH78_21130 [Solibacterales bacterium]|nr:hypothetical protein [Bryobacterales bacterium]